MKIKELFSDKSKWTQCADARRKDNEKTFAEDPNATCWCLRGAVFKLYPTDQYYDVLRKINNYLDDGVIVWNDDPERTFEEVKKLVEELDI